jgi:hypothetical protein
MSDDDNTPARRGVSPANPAANRLHTGVPQHRWRIFTPREYALRAQRYQCGYCDNAVGSDTGIGTAHEEAGVYICPICAKPTYIAYGIQVPPTKYGQTILHLPQDVRDAYEEARACMSIQAYTAAALIFRKILMHIAVDHGAAEGLQFIPYVNYLEANGYTTPPMKGWVDAIRKGGNAATHKIPAITRDEAENLLSFTEMLLRIVYEYPAKAGGSKP